VEYEWTDHFNTVCKQVTQNLTSGTDADGDYISKDEISDGTYLIIKPIASLDDCKDQCVQIKEADQGTDCHGVEYFPPKEKCDIFTQPFTGSAKNNGRSCSEYLPKGSPSELTFLTWKTKNGRGVQKAAAIKSAGEPLCDGKPCAAKMVAHKNGNIKIEHVAKDEAAICEQPPCQAADLDAVNKQVCSEPGMSCSERNSKASNFWLIGLSAGVVAFVVCVALFAVRRSKSGEVSKSVSTYAVVMEDQAVSKTGL
jgi:hypothetical protein